MSHGMDIDTYEREIMQPEDWPYEVVPEPSLRSEMRVPNAKANLATITNRYGTFILRNIVLKLFSAEMIKGNYEFGIKPSESKFRYFLSAANNLLHWLCTGGQAHHSYCRGQKQPQPLPRIQPHQL
jgi:hypothetical protein